MPNPIGGPSPATSPHAQSSLPCDGITVNGKPAQIVNGQVQIPKGAKVEIKTHYGAGVFQQGPAEVTLAKTGTGAKSATTQAQLKKEWKMRDETFSSANGDPVDPHVEGGTRYENFSFTAPKTADGSGLAITLNQPSRQAQTINLVPVAAQAGPIVAKGAAPALTAAQPETAEFGGRPGGFGHPGGFPGHPGGFPRPGGPGGFPHGPDGPWHRPEGRPWFNPWNFAWGAMPPGWYPGCEWNPAWGGCPPGYYVP